MTLMKEKGMEPEVGGLSFDYEKYREEQYQPAGRHDAEVLGYGSNLPDSGKGSVNRWMKK
ncbi:MAG: hypothetical protein ACLT76_05395 [Clostridium fessum]